MASPQRISVLAASLLLLPVAAADVAAAAAPACTKVGTPGDDVLIGTSSADVLCGNGGNDVLRGLGGNDVLRGGVGDDTLQPGRGSNVAHGNAGVDTLSYVDLTTGTVFVDLANGIVTRSVDDRVTTVENVIGTAGNDRIIGTDDANRLLGREGNDVLLGGPGDDELIGAAGNDTFYPGMGSNLIHGHSGVDTVRYDDLASGTVDVNIPAGTVTRAVDDTLTTTENVFGTARNDRITGGDLPNRMVGQGGNDVIFGGLGADEILGAEGNDRIHPGGGDDTADGGLGTDQVSYQELLDSLGVSVDLAAGLAKDLYRGTAAGDDIVLGFEDLVGTWGFDILKGTNGPNYINGNEANDNIYPRLGVDRIVGGGDTVTTIGDPFYADGDYVSYDDVTVGGVTVDLVQGIGPGGGTIDGFIGVTGTDQDDVLVGPARVASGISGLGGNDQIQASQSCARVIGGEGDDVLKPAPDNPGIDCGDLPQRISGGAGQDTASYVHATTGIRLSASGGGWFSEGFDNAYLDGIEIVRATTLADELFGGLGAIQVTFYGRGGADAMNTTDESGGDSMIQDGSGAGTTCVGDATDTVSC